MTSALQTHSTSIDDLLGSCKLALFGGKGGVGKTTLASALAVKQAVQYNQKNVLLVSSDPAHSLKSLFGHNADGALIQERSGIPFICPFPQLPNFFIHELNLPKLTEDFRDKYGTTVQTVMERGSILDDRDLEAFMELSLPALGELMALISLMELLDDNSFDLIVLDTAPTGHTLRLLDLPHFLKLILEPINLMENKHQFLVSSLVGKYKQDNTDRLLAQLTESGANLAERLKDKSFAGMFVVMLPERLSVEESSRLITGLVQRQLPVKAVIVNNMTQSGCSFCNQRKGYETQYLDEISSSITSVPVYKASALSCEIKGCTNLASLAGEITRVENLTHSENLTPSRSIPKVSGGKLPDYLGQGTKLVVFAGKGGVGKTTFSAASAWHIADKYPDKTVLVASIDPAHSLADSLETALCHTPCQIAPNLYACEIDAATLLREFKTIYAGETLGLLSQLLGQPGEKGMSLSYDQTIAEQLLDVDSPDIDEFLVFRQLVDFSTSGKFDIIVLDPAPSGHLLRFLELPSVAHPWIKAGLEVIHRHNTVDQSKATVKELLRLLHAIKDFQIMITDPGQTAVIAVTSPRDLVVAGTKELLSSMTTLKIPCNTVLINMVRPDNTDCSFCHPMYSLQEDIINAFPTLYPGRQIISVSQTSCEIKGREQLLALGEALYG